jgi:ankyrin repeat protein
MTKYGHASIVETLIENGADLNHASSRGSTALKYAAMSGHTGIIETLLEAGADPNPEEDYRGKTPLMYARENGHEETKRLLREYASAA